MLFELFLVIFYFLLCFEFFLVIFYFILLVVTFVICNVCHKCPFDILCLHVIKIKVMATFFLCDIFCLFLRWLIILTVI